MQGMDGMEGSLCTDTPAWKRTHVGCKPGLACEPLVGPLRASGYGYCVVLSASATPTGFPRSAAASSLARVKTTARRTVGGLKCRLPVVYKCAASIQQYTTCTVVVLDQ